MNFRLTNLQIIFRSSSEYFRGAETALALVKAQKQKKVIRKLVDLPRPTALGAGAQLPFQLLFLL